MAEAERVTRPMRAVMWALSAQDDDTPLYAAKLGDKLGVPESTLRPLLKRLQERGYITRTRDKRPATELGMNPPVYLRLTDRGRRKAIEIGTNLTEPTPIAPRPTSPHRRPRGDRLTRADLIGAFGP